MPNDYSALSVRCIRPRPDYSFGLGVLLLLVIGVVLCARHRAAFLAPNILILCWKVRKRNPCILTFSMFASDTLCISSSSCVGKGAMAWFICVEYEKSWWVWYQLTTPTLFISSLFSELLTLIKCSGRNFESSKFFLRCLWWRLFFSDSQIIVTPSKTLHWLKSAWWVGL